MTNQTSSIFWNDSLLTGIDSIDQQHKHLFQLVYELYEAMRRSEGDEILDRLLDELIVYTRYHFGLEEELMEAASYAGLEAHRAEHAGMTRRVVELRRQAGEGGFGVTVDTMDFLKDWLVHHIGVTDRGYIQAVKEYTAKKQG